jgi:hypothetical protein
MGWGPGASGGQSFPSNITIEGHESSTVENSTSAPGPGKISLWHRQAWDDPGKPEPPRIAGPIPWKSPFVNETSFISQIWQVPETIDPVYQTRSAVTATCSGCTVTPSGTNVSAWDGAAQSTVHIPDTEPADNFVVNVGFHHDIRRLEDGGTTPEEATWIVAPNSSGGCSVIPATPASGTATLTSGQEERVSTTTPIPVNIAKPAAGGTTTCTLKQTNTLNPTSFAEVTITRGAPPPEIPGGDPGAPPTAPPSAEVYSSHIRAQAIINNNVIKQAAEACHAGLAGNTTGSWLTGKLGCSSTTTTADRAYARPGQNIAFGWTGQLVALHSRTTSPANRTNFPAFSVNHTVCGASGSSDVGDQCIAKIPPGSQLSLDTIPPAPSPALRNEWAISNQNGQSGMEPISPGQNVLNASVQNPRGTGHTVSNSLLGTRNIECQQTLPKL